MTITLTGTAGLFTRLGKLVHYLNTVNTARGTTIQAEAIDAVETIDADDDPAIRAAFGDLVAQLANGQNGLAGLLSGCRQAAERLLVRQVDADNRLVALTVDQALLELIRQMAVGDQYVDANAVAAAATQTNLDGDGVVVASVKDVRGNNLENLLAEDLECRVTNNSTAGSESIQVRGEVRQSDKLHWLWPAGSGSQQTYTAVDAAGESLNKLLNGGFEDWTAGEADDWTDDVGAYATDWLEEASTVYAGSKGVELVGDGATLAQISQDITARVAALKQYAICLWLCRDGTPAAAGALTIDLYDGAGVIDDEAGTANSVVIDLTALTAAFVPYVAVFRLPDPKPAEVTFRIRLSTALTSGRSVFFDHLALAEMRQPLSNDPGATPFLAIFSGASPFTLDDYSGGGDGTRVFKVATTNDAASEWQRAFNRLYLTSEKGLLLPVAGSNLINDSLIG